MRVLITGSREVTDPKPISDALRQAYMDAWANLPMVVVHGDCPTGADRIARDIIRREMAQGDGPNRLYDEPHPADWDQYGKAAGFRRNAEMVSLGADICLAFFQDGAGNKGTTHCADAAEKAGIPTKRIVVK
jgi:hypothetical protein